MDNFHNCWKICSQYSWAARAPSTVDNDITSAQITLKDFFGLKLKYHEFFHLFLDPIFMLYLAILPLNFNSEQENNFIQI